MPQVRPRSTLAWAVALWVPLVVAPTVVHAQGYELNDIGACAMAKGYANTGSPCKDPSSIYWNPGATTDLPGFSLYVGASAISVLGSFTADQTLHQYNPNVPLVVPPNIFVNYTNYLGDHKYALGFGTYVPYGLISQWRADFPGDFESQRASLQSIYLQPNVAFDLVPKRLSIGAGPVIGVSTVDLQRHLDLSTEEVPGGGGATFAQIGIAPGTEFGTLHAHASATAVGFNAGIHFTPSDNWSFGARYLSKLSFDYNSGTANFNQIATNLVLAANNPLGLPGGTPIDALLAQSGAFNKQGVTTAIPMPYQLEIGGAYKGISQTTIELDWELTGYSAFKQLPLTFQGSDSLNSRALLEDYHDSWSIRSGIEHVFGDPVLGFVGRVGFSYINSPAPDVTVTPLLPDASRYNTSIGFGFPFSKFVALDGSYVHVGTMGRRGRLVERSTVVNTDATASELNTGYYTLTANVFALNLKFTY
jgi:long-chain fatty acid transport protein